MSFLVDPPLLYASGEACARLEPRRARVAGTLIVALFWAVSGALYANRPWRGGRAFMWSSGVLPAERGPHALALAIFATYPAWLALGYRRARR